MTSFGTAGSTEKNNTAAGVLAEGLRSDEGEYQIAAAAAAIPAHMRREVLAHLHELICADATHTVAVCK
jgi:hypothetical protein